MENDHKGNNHALPQDPENDGRVEGIVDNVPLTMMSKEESIRQGKLRNLEMFEEKKGLSLIEPQELKKYGYWGSDFYNKLTALSRYGNIPSMFLVGTYDSKHSNSTMFKIYFFTDNHEYCITIRFPQEDEPMLSSHPGNKSYLGCVASGRKPRPGLIYTGGRDLSDGEYTEATWFKILNDIISFEIKNLQI